MLVNHFGSRAIVEHWYQIVSIDFHEHAMAGMMVLRQRYALVFGYLDVRNPCQGRGFSREYVAEKGMLTELGRCVTAQRGLPNFSGDCVI